jgi:transposase
MIIALTFAAEIDPSFKSGRHLAASIGLTPKEHSTGGNQRMGGISRAGNEVAPIAGDRSDRRDPISPSGLETSRLRNGW